MRFEQEERKKFDEKNDKTLATAISEAVEKAMSLCDEGRSSAAWEVVEELSANAINGEWRRRNRSKVCACVYRRM